MIGAAPADGGATANAREVSPAFKKRLQTLDPKDPQLGEKVFDLMNKEASEFYETGCRLERIALLTWIVENDARPKINYLKGKVLDLEPELLFPMNSPTRLDPKSQPLLAAVVAYASKKYPDNDRVRLATQSLTEIEIAIDFAKKEPAKAQQHWQTMYAEHPSTADCVTNREAMHQLLRSIAAKNDATRSPPKKK